MKLLLAVAAVIGVGVVVSRSTRSEADLWHEATAPTPESRTPPTGT